MPEKDHSSSSHGETPERGSPILMPGKSIVTIEDPTEIITILKKVVAKDRIRANIILNEEVDLEQENHLDVSLDYEVRETPEGIILVESHESHNGTEKETSVGVNIHEYLAMLFRHAFEISHLVENIENYRRIINWAVNQICDKESIGKKQKKLSAANIMIIERAINSLEAQRDPAQKGIRRFFYDLGKKPEKKLTYRLSNDKEALSELERKKYVLEELELRRKRDQERGQSNYLFELIDQHDNGVKVGFDAPKELVDVMTLITQTIEQALRATLTHPRRISPAYIRVVTKNAVDRVLGSLKLRHKESAIPQDILSSIEENITNTRDPYLIGAVHTSPRIQRKRRG